MTKIIRDNIAANVYNLPEYCRGGFFVAENFAFETGEVSVAFRFMHGLGDSVVARKVFDAVIELVAKTITKV